MTKLHPITKKAYEKADAYQPQEDGKYAWVWDYALFRFNRMSSNVQRSEDKALELLKFVIGMVAAIWALFAFFHPRLVIVNWATEELTVLALAFLFVSALCFLAAYVPVKHLSPVAEDAALRHADAYKNPEAAVAKFSQQFAASTEYEKDLLAHKSWRIQLGVWLLFLAFTFFLFALFYETSHSNTQSLGPRGALVSEPQSPAFPQHPESAWFASFRHHPCRAFYTGQVNESST